MQGKLIEYYGGQCRHFSRCGVPLSKRRQGRMEGYLLLCIAAAEAALADLRFLSPYNHQLLTDFPLSKL